MKPVYQPLIIPSDRIIRAPITPWQQQLLRDLGTCLQPGRADIAQLAPQLNQLALTAAYESQNELAHQLCDAQIRFWQHWAHQHHDDTVLAFAVQPWINIIRLDRWQNRVETTGSLYQELAPQNRTLDHTLGQQYQIDFSLDALCQLAPEKINHRILDNIFWHEYGKQLLDSGQYSSLQAHLQTGLVHCKDLWGRANLLELMLIYQHRIGNDAVALATLARMRWADHAPFRLPFQMLELYLKYQTGAADVDALSGMVADAIAGQTFRANGFGLYSLHALAEVFRLIDQPERELPLLVQAEQLAEQTDDEVLRFEIRTRRAELGDYSRSEAQQPFADSRYTVIRKKLQVPPIPANDAPLTQLISDVARQLASFDLDGCRQLLAPFTHTPPMKTAA